MWSKGIIAGPTTGEHYKYWVKHFEEGSQYGIDGGKISKLAIRKVDSALDLCNYDRGWDIEPTTDEVKAVYAIIVSKYN